MVEQEFDFEMLLKRVIRMSGLTLDKCLDGYPDVAAYLKQQEGKPDYPFVPQATSSVLYFHPHCVQVVVYSEGTQATLTLNWEQVETLIPDLQKALYHAKNWSEVTKTTYGESERGNEGVSGNVSEPEELHQSSREGSDRVHGDG